MQHSDFDRLLLLFKRSHSLPELPGIAMRLIEAVDSGEASAVQIEKIISADPLLSTKVLRLANTAQASSGHEVATIRMAILRLGQRSVRALGVSLIMQKLSGNAKAPCFNAQRLGRHSLMVGLLARYLLVRRMQKEKFETRWSGDEVFAAGLLHELAIALLSQVDPESYIRVHGLASRQGLSIGAAFEKIYGQPIVSLASAAAEAWRLPEIFVTVFKHVDQPWAHPEEYQSLCCLNYANHLAMAAKITTEDWVVTSEAEPEVAEEVGLAPEEIQQVIQHLTPQVEQYFAAEGYGRSGRAA